MNNQIDQLLQILLPNPIIMYVDQVIEKRSHSDVQVKLTHRHLVFTSSSLQLQIAYSAIYAMHIESQDEFTLIVSDPENSSDSHVHSMMIHVRSSLAPQLLNNVQYRQSVSQVWARRLRFGVIREALRYPLMLSQLNSNRSIFGQLSPAQLLQLSDQLQDSAHRAPESFYGEFVPPASSALLDSLAGWRAFWSFRENEEPMVSPQFSLAQTSTLPSTLLTLNAQREQTSLLLNTRGEEGPRLETFSGLFERAKRQRQKLQDLTGQTEQMRIKGAADSAQLQSPKLYQRQQYIARWFNPLSPQYSSFQEACLDLREQMDPVRNTVLRDNRRLLQSLQVVQTSLSNHHNSLYKAEEDRSDLLDPVNLLDVAAISVEQLSFGAVFPRLWRRAKRDYKERDLLVRRACARLQQEETLLFLLKKTQKTPQESKVGTYLEEFLDIPEKFRDPAGFSLCIEELRQLDSPKNMSPRQFLNALLETVVCIQLTVNTQTQAGNEAKRKMTEQFQHCYNVAFGADDLLPIFICVLIRADLKHAATAAAIMEFLCDPAQLNDEYGYYLTCFQSSLDFVIRRYKDALAAMGEEEPLPEPETQKSASTQDA